MNFKSLEDKCLYYRGLTDYRLQPNSNVIAMVDGRSFSKLIKKKYKLPFDSTFISMMNETAKYVCENVQGCKLAYVQSDEISFLITDYDAIESDSFFGFRLCKMQSIIASLATAKFNQLCMANDVWENSYDRLGLDTEDTLYNVSDVINFISEHPLVQFDCKVWTVPSSNDAFAWFLYRQNDCIRNSKQQAAQTYLPHKTLVGKNTDEQLKLLYDEKGIDWNYAFNDGEKYGRFVYQSPKHMSKEINGKVIEFDRKTWDAHDAFVLAEDGGRNRFYNLVPVLNAKIEEVYL
jgi:tRNA(His) 5'-end guanylyltransferase